MFADTKINCTFALAIRKNSNNKGLIPGIQELRNRL